MNFMDIAIDESKKAIDEGNVPVGCVIVKNDEVISAAHNTKNSSNIAINHAEILAIDKACRKLNTWYLNDCELYVTLKPCDMCTAAIAEARINKVYYLLDSNYVDNLSKNIENINFVKLNVISEYDKIISGFFKTLRD